MSRELTSEQELLLAEVIGQLADSVAQGGQADLQLACQRHPELAAELRHLWGAVLVADGAATLSKRNSSSTLASLNRAEANLGDEFQLPCRFGDYELLEQIGRGGMGVVYRARQLSLNREVAVKMILGGGAEADRARFQAEAESAACLQHPNIVPVYEVGQWQGRLYFSMKYIRGQTFSQHLEEHSLEQRRIAEILEEVARAVHYAHRRGVLHRDLKPSNILIDEEGRSHITDFGLAKRLESAENLTGTGAVLGTPAYMSPEQAAGNLGRLGPASDVYSLGSILYHALTGQPPFTADSPVNILLKLLEQDVTPPRELDSRIDRDMELIALRCLQRPPDLRYPSAEALADDLRAFRKDETIAARSGRLGQVLARLFRETHHAIVLENWGLLWMWHSLVLLVACCTTNIMWLSGMRGESDRWWYAALWTVALWAWAAVFWILRRRMGPVLFVERQIAHVWAGSMVCIGLMFPLEILMGEPVLRLSPMVALINGMAFLVKAGILNGAFYIQSAALFATAALMAWRPDYAHFIFGVVAAGCFFFPGWKYYSRRRRQAALNRPGQ